MQGCRSRCQGYSWTAVAAQAFGRDTAPPGGFVGEDARRPAVEVPREVTGVGLALRVVRLQVPAAVPITDRKGALGAPINLAKLKPGDVIRVSFGSRPTGLVAYTIERVGRMEVGVVP